MNLKELFRKLLLILMLPLLFSCTKRTSSANVSFIDEPVKIIIASDLHYLAPSLHENSNYFKNLMSNADGKLTEYSEEIIDAWIIEVINQKPDAVILAGDLTFNGEKLSHQQLTDKLQQLTDNNIAVLVIPGNHDIDNPSAAKFDESGYTLVESVSTNEFYKIYDNFGYNEAISIDNNSGSYVYELRNDLWLLMIDINGKQKALNTKTLAFIKEVFVEAKNKNIEIIGISHQNLMAHNDLFTDSFVMGNNDELLSLYQKYDIKLHLSGHMHLQHLKTINNLNEIAQSSLTVGPCSYGILDITSENIKYSTQSLDTGKGDSINYFKNVAYQKTYNHLIAEGVETDMAKMRSIILVSSLLPLILKLSSLF